ncbi:MAG TPA: phosphopantothenoylcysteine decarboxylase [bacterium]|nr:phosphopantothenoylcysteine decarboxylase [bacterium]
MKKRRRPLRVLVTAGPTREYIDPVRYLSNDSSGTMGFAIAAAAARLGLSVTLIAGPVGLETPAGVRRIDVVSAEQMQKQAVRHALKADVVVMAAAVSDFRPARFHASKMKRSRVGGKGTSIHLKENPDILSEISRLKKPGQTVVGFALETCDLERNARKKLAEKGCDWIVANLASAIGARSSRAVLFGKNCRRVPLPRLPKEELAVLILSHVL